MKFSKWSIAIGIFVVVVAAAAQTPVLIHISQVMSKTELEETGVASLNEQQRTALDIWLNKFVRRAIAAGANAAVPTYSGTGKHWIDEVDRDGALVVLEDDSLWQVDDSDQTDTNLWLSTTDITVENDPHPTGDFKYILRDTEDHESAHAKYLGSL